jgi:hypothetical protein
MFSDSQDVKIERDFRRAKMIKLSKKNRTKGRTEFGRNLYNPKVKNGNSLRYCRDCPCHPCPTNILISKKRDLQLIFKEQLLSSKDDELLHNDYEFISQDIEVFNINLNCYNDSNRNSYSDDDGSDDRLSSTWEIISNNSNTDSDRDSNIYSDIDSNWEII